MSQGHRRHGGRGSTLLYYIGLEGKEGGRRRDRTAQAARCTGQGERKTEGQKNRKKINGTEVALRGARSDMHILPKGVVGI